MLYAAKCYWPQVTAQEVQDAADRAAHVAHSVSRPGCRATYVGSMLFPDDELVLCVFDSPSAIAVKEINERAGIPCERVMRSLWLGGDLIQPPIWTHRSSDA
jgi:hypothetical protein